MQGESGAQMILSFSSVRGRSLIPTVSVLLVLAASALSAQDDHLRSTTGIPRTLGGTSPSGSERIPPPDVDDTLFVVDSGSGLDTGCTYRGGGPLIIHLKVGRFVGDVGPGGNLLDSAKLISHGLISPKAHLFLPAFDVDVHGASGVPPEVDRVSFNGHVLGALTGDNQVWKLNDFEIPIDWIKFPSDVVLPVTPADNVLQIDIDTASGTQEHWCTAVDWVELKFNAIAPIFLVHGTNADSTTWTRSFTDSLVNAGVPWSNDINLTPNGSILGNGRLLAARLTALAADYGAKKCHIIAHSKGGLDTRAYLNHQYDRTKLKVLSVYTLSTPHHGTIISDIFLVARATESPDSSDPDLKFILDQDRPFLTHFDNPCISLPHGQALNNLTIDAMAEFNRNESSVPSGVLLYNYGADADLNHNQVISLDETTAFFDVCSKSPIPGSPFSEATKIAFGTALYRTIGNVARITTTLATRRGQPWDSPVTFIQIEIDAANNSFALNDFTVSARSATWPDNSHYLGTILANHTTIKSREVAESILAHIGNDFPNR
jgi:triacylglycerol lipase